MKNKPIQQFLLLLVVILGTAFLVHTFALEATGFLWHDNMIGWSYATNGILAAAIFGLLYYYRYKLKNSIGFLFMAGSFLKFILFFLLFYPVYKADGDIDRLEFGAFFIPYLLCLILETVFTAKMLQKLD